VEWEPETRAAVALFSTDEDGGSWEIGAKSIRTNIGNAQDPAMYNVNQGLIALAGALRNFSIQVKRELDSIGTDVG
jgi:hypothetical protein